MDTIDEVRASDIKITAIRRMYPPVFELASRADTMVCLPLLYILIYGFGHLAFVLAQVADRITEEGGRPSEERRLVTAPFADLSGFTPLADTG